MNADELEKATDLLLENVKGWEQRTIATICERIKELGYISPTDARALKNIVDFTGDITDVTNDLAKTLATTTKEIEDLYVQTLEYTQGQKESLFNLVDLTQVAYKDNKKAQAIVEAYMKTTTNAMRNLSMTNTLYLTAADGVRKPFNEAYQSILDKAVLAVSTGAGDFNSEMRNTIAQLGGGGVRANYGGGVTRRLDTVIRQNILYGAKQASIEYDEIMGEELGCDGFEVDYHPNPRESHAFMGGVMFSSNEAKTVAGVYYPSGVTALARLNDYGCLHDKRTVILGISEPTYSKEELQKLKAQDEEVVEIDGVSKTRYEWKQEQRKLETAIRYKKDEANAFKASGDMQGRREVQTKIDSLTDKYDKLTDKAGLTPTYERMEVKGYNKVKTVNQLQNSSSGSIIEYIEDSDLFARATPLDDGYKQMLEDRFNDGNETAKKVYKKYVLDGGAVANGDYLGTAHYSPMNNEINMNFSKDNSGSTWYHEHGHYIDANSGRSSYSQDFIKTLENDVKNYEKIIKEGNSFKNISEVRHYIGQELSQQGISTYGIQDIFGGVISKPYPSAMVGHAEKYWKIRGSNGLGSEAFANMFEASFDVDKGELMEKYLPTAWAEFQKMLGGL